MRIALLGGNGYTYSNAPSYVHANGRGYITQSDLLGQDEGRTPTPKEAYESVQYFKSQGWEPTAEMQALANQYKEDRGFGIVEGFLSLGQKGIELGQQIVGQKTAIDPNAGQAADNTALIIIGGVAAVAVVGVLLSKKKKR